MFKSILRALAAAWFAIGLAGSTSSARAQAGAGDLVRQISAEVIETARNDKAIQGGDIGRVITLVEAKVMPHVNFEVITRSAVGPKWREATPDQRTRLQAEFKTLLVRIYAGALAQVRDQMVEVTRTVPLAGGTQVVVQTEVHGKGDPIKLDYRLDKETDPPAWKLIDVNVGGLWLAQNYRIQFAPELTRGGVEGLIAALTERNRANAKRPPS